MLTIGEPMAVFAAGDTDAHLKDVSHWSMHTAGAELNVAVGIARLGLAADYVSAVGDDPFGHFLAEQAAQMGVGTEHWHFSAEHPTGIYFKQRVSAGDPEVFYRRAGSAASHFAASNLEQIDFTKYNIAHLSGIFPAISENAQQVFAQLLTKCREHNIFTTFDPNIRLPLWKDRAEMVRVLNECAASANLVLPGVNEGELLFGTRDPEEIALRYLQNSETTQYVVVKLGEQGALLAQRAQSGAHEVLSTEVGAPATFTYIPGFNVDQVVDTVGAGDGFAVGLISALMDGESILEATTRACAIGALAVRVAGDNEGYPTRPELDQFMKGERAVCVQ